MSNFSRPVNAVRGAVGAVGKYARQNPGAMAMHTLGIAANVAAYSATPDDHKKYFWLGSIPGTMLARHKFNPDGSRKRRK